MVLTNDLILRCSPSFFSFTSYFINSLAFFLVKGGLFSVFTSFLSRVHVASFVNKMSKYQCRRQQQATSAKIPFFPMWLLSQSCRPWGFHNTSGFYSIQTISTIDFYRLNKIFISTVMICETILNTDGMEMYILFYFFLHKKSVFLGAPRLCENNIINTMT